VNEDNVVVNEESENSHEVYQRTIQSAILAERTVSTPPVEELTIEKSALTVQVVETEGSLRSIQQRGTFVLHYTLTMLNMSTILN